ncbi:glucosamine-6-phosphate deaminase [Gluconobacter sp. Dm-62]|uniref:glucosamine-6-phosphate deaminase n=1 Tax=Gluconobacter sp. Dm-62 TaxID=2799804 RepID=UPI001B8C55FF|nr:glucosamine-6-phosphate deaminase [Gluconobacter sp. Dm-62]MBS1103194.1 glucosamine-6-phosphate deaminase [Gluconobacter sp. Dm-62]
MNIITVPTSTEAVEKAATIVADEIRSHAAPVLGLATGRTMESLYALLVARYRKGALDFSSMTSFNLDEYVGIAASAPQSYHTYMHEHLFDQVNMQAGHGHVPDGMAADLDAECAAYEDRIRASGGINLQLLGIGETGHIGFNEPPSAFDTRTRPVVLDPITRQQNAGMFGNNPDAVPERALTMGVGTILDAKRLLLLAVGGGKAAIIRKALLDPMTPDISASAIRLHKDCTIIMDDAAAAEWKRAA